MIKVILLVLAAIVSAIAYRLGGASGYNTKYRDIGCSLLCCLSMGVFIAWHWTLILVFGLMWGALSTYFKKKGTDARWYHWLIVGLAFSLATIPYIIATGYWLGFLSRSIILAGSICIWSEINGNAIWEECGRGALIILTIPIILIS